MNRKLKVSCSEDGSSDKRSLPVQMNESSPPCHAEDESLDLLRLRDGDRQIVFDPYAYHPFC